MEKKVRKTTYQRLKEERQTLLNDIRVMVMSPDSINATHLRIKYKLNFQMADLIMIGDYSKENKSNGIEKFITTK